MDRKLLIVAIVISLLAVSTIAVAQRFGDPARGRIPDLNIPPREQYAGYLKIKGIEGESKDQNHDKWIDVLALSMEGNADFGGTARPVTSVLEDILVKKKMDKASPLLQEALASGESFDWAIIELVGRHGPFMEYNITEIEISRYSMNAFPGSGQSRPVEEIAIFYSRIDFKYTLYDSRGRVIEIIEGHWDREFGT